MIGLVRVRFDRAALREEMRRRVVEALAERLDQREEAARLRESDPGRENPHAILTNREWRP